MIQIKSGAIMALSLALLVHGAPYDNHRMDAPPQVEVEPQGSGTLEVATGVDYTPAQSRSDEPATKVDAQPASKVTKAVKRSGTGLQQPETPVYHVAPINAFTLADLGEEDDGEGKYVYKAKPADEWSSNQRAGLFAPNYGQYDEQRYFGSSNPSPALSAVTGAKYASKPPTGKGSYINYAYAVENGGTGGQYGIEEEEEVDEEIGGPYGKGWSTGKTYGWPAAPITKGWSNNKDLGWVSAVPAKQGWHGVKKAPAVVCDEECAQQFASAAAQVLKPKPKFNGWSEGPTHSIKPANIESTGSSGAGWHNELKWPNHRYDFAYEVISHGDPHHGKSEPQFFGHAEHSDGHVTKGRYHVLLPDGRHQKVAYTADHDGYHAHVSYN